jgi:hypothetical protein
MHLEKALDEMRRSLHSGKRGRTATFLRNLFIFLRGKQARLLTSGCVFTTLRFLRNLRIGPIS